MDDTGLPKRRKIFILQPFETCCFFHTKIKLEATIYVRQCSGVFHASGSLNNGGGEMETMETEFSVQRLSLSFRLFGNVVADELTVGVSWPHGEGAIFFLQNEKWVVKIKPTGYGRQILVHVSPFTRASHFGSPSKLRTCSVFLRVLISPWS